MKVSKRELVQDNIAAFGFAEAARIAKKQGMCFTHFYWLAFDCVPRWIPAAPMHKVNEFYDIFTARCMSRHPDLV